MLEAERLQSKLWQKWFDAEIADWRLFRVAAKVEKRNTKTCEIRQNSE